MPHTLISTPEVGYTVWYLGEEVTLDARQNVAMLLTKVKIDDCQSVLKKWLDLASTLLYSEYIYPNTVWIFFYDESGGDA